MHSTFLNLLATATLAVFTCSFGPQAVGALSIEHGSDILSRGSSHHGMAKRRRMQRRASCRARPASSTTAVSSSSSVAAPASSSAVAAVAVAASTSGSSGSNSGSTYTTSVTTSGAVYSGGGGKACLAWPNGDTGKLAAWKTSHTSCLYTWSSWPLPAASALGFEVLPQLWGDKDTYDFSQNIGSYTTPTWILGFNEPNESGQSSMTTDHAVQLWWQYMEPQRANGHKLVSPAVSSSPAGFEWMKDFFAKCAGCHIDMVATHYYDVSVQGFIDYQTKYHNQFNLPILVTEFACQNFNGGAQCSDDEISNFNTKTTQWMDSTDWILKYMAFGAMHDMFNVNYAARLMADDGTPNALGLKYINGA
ncbi:glycoside hydrolase family 128 protein [Cylindrobasidium torrendii FP15055 ss-10]|uniref:Glycoside hydrolase family 128 protein n=1 Tax=Cylindrobasidium torrendii FP15055 ss-10 TaxID=1314674 RepID=A0A0D7BNM0_9AGAR|nr:glycoside hydrolase family 128 protein [Cylindrobasidium torrendii FP15055 ss-10]